MKHGIAFQVRSEMTENPRMIEGFASIEEFEAVVQDAIDQRIRNLGLDEPWYSPQRIGLTMYKILLLDFGHATFLTSDAGSSDVRDIIFEKMPRTILLFTTATIVISMLGIFLGALAGSKVGSPIDRITSSFAVISSSFPVWWIGMLMIFLFSFIYQIFPARATPDIPASDPGYLGSPALPHDTPANHNSADRFWLVGVHRGGTSWWESCRRTLSWQRRPLG